MKKPIIILLSVLSIFFLFGCARIDIFNSEYIDFSRLTVSDIKRIYIFSYENRYGEITKMAELTYDDIEDLLPLLNQVELIGTPTEEFKDVSAMYWEMYRIELENGQEFDFAANKDYYVIDMQGYAADEETGTEIFTQNRGWYNKYFNTP